MDKYSKLRPAIVNPYQHLYAQYPAYTVEKDSMPYIKESMAQKAQAAELAKHGQEYRVSDERIERLHDFLLEGYLGYGNQDVDAFEKFWQEFEPVARTHSALVNFIHDKHNDHSRIYCRWAIDVIRDNATAKAMMLVVGQGYDWLGNPQEILEDDNAMEGVVCDWTLVEARWRQMKARSAMLTAQNVMIVGAGYLPELWDKYGGQLPDGLQILACDMDPSIPRAELEAKHPGLSYRLCDGLELLQDPANAGKFDVVNMPGFMSYNIDEFDTYMAAAMACLRPGGVLLFDLQLLHPGMAYIGLMMDWSAGSAKPIKLLERPQIMELVTHAAELCDVADWGYSSSGRYDDPATILFEFHKK